VKTTLIVGIETLAGRYLAAHFSNTQRVIGVRTSDRSTEPAMLINDKVDQVIFCGDASASSWETNSRDSLLCQDSQNLVSCLQACKATDRSFVFLSSDHVFDGPWMFHTEESSSFAQTPRAHSIRSQEEIVGQYKKSLVVRTHVTGFSPGSLLSHSVFGGLNQEYSASIHHATPIHAGRFPMLLEELLRHQPIGLYHLAGGERISRNQLLTRLALEFGGIEQVISGSDRQSPRRETSLRSSRAKSLLDSGLPTIADLMADIATDLDSGVAEKMTERTLPAPSKVA
jgi:dTDP-4-dehydrorhamnose reductase